VLVSACRRHDLFPKIRAIPDNPPREILGNKPVASNGRTIWIADAHRRDGQRFMVRVDEKLTAFLEVESAICPSRRIGLTDKRDFFKTPAVRKI
jgi:hypothetical protein